MDSTRRIMSRPEPASGDSRHFVQFNVKLSISSERDMAAIIQLTGESKQALIRRLLREEYGRQVLGLDIDSPELKAAPWHPDDPDSPAYKARLAEQGEENGK